MSCLSWWKWLVKSKKENAIEPKEIVRMENNVFVRIIFEIYFYHPRQIIDN